MQVLKKLTLSQWAWVHFKLSLGVGWAFFMAFWPPTGVVKTLDQPLITVWMSLTLMGAVVSLIGYVMTQAGAGKVSGVLGVSVELTGLSFFVVGPLIYFFTQSYLALNGGWDDRVALAAFAYAMCAVLAYRFVVVVLRFRREKHDESKED